MLERARHGGFIQHRPPKALNEYTLNPAKIRNQVRNEIAFRIISNLGIASERSHPWISEAGDCPTDAAYLDARKTRAVEHCLLDPDHTIEAKSLFGIDEKKAVGAMTLICLK